MNRLKIDNLQKTYPGGVKALAHISLDITNGMFGLLGPNGAGKSTLMKTIAGLQSADGGSIIFNGVDVLADPQEIKKQLGFLPQDFGVYPKIAAAELLDHIAVLKGMTNAGERREQVSALLEKVNLYQHRQKEVHNFSGGMRQRFGIAQALLGAPRIIIVDEPTAGLDPEERRRFNGLLNEIGENIIIILSTHLVEDVKMLCPQMAVMTGGSIRAAGEPAKFIENLQGKLWRRDVRKQELTDFENEFQIVSKQYTIGKLSITILSDTDPQKGFEPLEPNLEDAYFSLIYNAD